MGDNMGYLRRSFYSIFRNPMRSFVIFLIVFSMGSIVAASIATEQTASQLLANTESELSYTATLAYNENLQQLDPASFTSNFYNNDLADEIGTYEGVQNYDFSNRLTTKTLTFNELPLLIDFSGQQAYRISDFELKGTQNGSISSFYSGKILLKEGRMFTAEELSNGSMVVMIPENIAIYNGINIGDSLEITNFFYEGDKANSYGASGTVDETTLIQDKISLEVIGIYNLSEGYAGKNGNLDNDYQRLYIPNSAISKINQRGIDFLNQIQTIVSENALVFNINENESLDYEFSIPYILSRASYLTATNYNYVFFDVTAGLKSPETVYFFDDKVDISEFQNYVSSVSEERLLAKSDYNTFQSILAPVKLVNMIATFTKYLAVVALIFVLTLVVQMFVNQRRYEIGVYRALGEKSYKIVTQIVIETLIVSLLALYVSIYSGIQLAKHTSTKLIDDQISEYRVFSWGNTEGLLPDMVVDKVETKFSIEISSEYLVEYYSIGILVVSVSSILPVIYLLRLNPKEVLL